MELTEQAFEFLVCPVCHARLTFAGEGIACTGCDRRYPIEDGLPILIPSRAMIAPDQKSARSA
jgi:uncharacterized protein YbaR (Trm112 family)